MGVSPAGPVSRQWKREPSSDDVNVNVCDVPLAVPDGPPVIVVCGRDRVDRERTHGRRRVRAVRTDRPNRERVRAVRERAVPHGLAARRVAAKAGRPIELALECRARRRRREPERRHGLVRRPARTGCDRRVGDGLDRERARGHGGDPRRVRGADRERVLAVRERAVGLRRYARREAARRGPRPVELALHRRAGLRRGERELRCRVTGLAGRAAGDRRHVERARLAIAPAEEELRLPWRRIQRPEPAMMISPRGAIATAEALSSPQYMNGAPAQCGVGRSVRVKARVHHHDRVHAGNPVGPVVLADGHDLAVGLDRDVIRNAPGWWTSAYRRSRMTDRASHRRGSARVRSAVRARRDDPAVGLDRHAP